MKRIPTMGVKLGAALALLILITACDNPTLGTNGGGTSPAGNVVIKLAGAGGRTALPKAPVFDKYEITLQKEDEPPVNVADTSGIAGAGVAVQLEQGTWAITLKAYQTLFGKSVLAAVGSASIEVKEGDRAKTVTIELRPLAIGESAEPGALSYTVTLPDSYDTVALSLKNSDGFEVLLEEETLSGNIALAPGYYDLSVVVTKNGQSAGLFETVHIYSGLESEAILDLSAAPFADKIYLMGTLGGVRLGTVTIATDAAGTSAIETLELDGSAAVRSANWIIAIPADYAGQTVYAAQEFNGARSAVAEVAEVPVYGVWDIALSAIPATPALVNVAPWYAELAASGGEATLAQAADGKPTTYWQSERGEENGPVWLEVDFGFNVGVNASRLVFYADSQTGSALVSAYNVQYLNGGGEWIQLASREQYFEGSADGSVTYGDFFAQTVTAQKFRWEVPGNAVENAPALIEFGLYKAAERGALSAAIPPAQNNHDTTLASADGEDIQRVKRWVTEAVKDAYQAAISEAQAARDDLFRTQQGIDAALDALNAATAAFDSAKQWGNLDDIVVNEFSVQDGYADKFVVTWLREPNYIYRLRISTSGSSWSQIAEFPVIEGSAEPQISTHVVTGIGAGQTRYFTMQAFEIDELGGEAGGNNVAASGAKVTMGVPVLSLASGPGTSYRAIDLSWTAARKADVYRIVYDIAGDSSSPHAVELAASELTPVAGGYAYTLTPNGYNNPIINGRKIDIKVEALNLALYQAVNCHKDDVTTASNAVETRLVGPAALNASATQAAAANNIALSWDSIEGAGGYYVYRRQFNLNNTAETAAAIAYYVDASGPAVTGKGIGGDAAKASAAFAGNRFTLTDSWMTDAEYSGAYSAYAANYKNQQNDIARGVAYRYFIVPVIAETDTVTFNASGATVAYTIDGIAYNDAASLERTGFTAGFGQNVSATRGTYASSGNVNDGVQISWSAPPLLASAGVTPQYTLYRKASGGGWETAATALTGTQYVSSNETRGTVYEYAVGVNGSQPQDSSRFMGESRAQVDGNGIPNVYGFMLEMVKLQSVSRSEIQVDGVFGERVTHYNNSNQYYNKGIDGFTVFLMNRNIGASWLDIGDIALEGDGTAATQDSLHLNVDNRLKVLRDYKHYFKIRSFVLNDSGTKVYCPDPDWNYETLFAANKNNQDNANFLQTDYVKWGARQITPAEFTKIATLFMAWGIHVGAGNSRGSWAGKLTNSWTNTSNNGSSGRVGRQHNGSTWWWFYFDNYKPDLDTNANRNDWTYSTTFVSLNTSTNTSDRRIISGNTVVSGQYPHTYTANGNYGADPCDITGPSCVSPLYSGKIRFSGLTWSGGTIVVNYPSGAAAVNVTGGGQNNTPLPFQSQSEDRRTVTNAWY